MLTVNLSIVTIVIALKPMAVLMLSEGFFQPPTLEKEGPSRVRWIS